MALINRMSRLLTADIHAVLDRLEEPQALLRQALREMEDEIARTEQHTRQLEREHEAVEARKQKLERTLAEVDAQLDVCFESGNEALARKLVRRKLETERLGKHLDERLATLAKDLAAQRATLVEQREHLDVIRQKTELMIESPDAETRACHDDGTGPFVGDDEVEVAFLRERQRRRPS